MWMKNEIKIFSTVIFTMLCVNGFSQSTSCPTDINKNGVTNNDDLQLLLTQWTHAFPPGPHCAADINRDGIISTADLLLLLAKCNTQCNVRAFDVSNIVDNKK